MKDEAWQAAPCPIYTVYFAMIRLTYGANAGQIVTGYNLDAHVQNKREGRRLNASKARRRRIRYKKRLANELIRLFRTKNEKFFEAKDFEGAD